jgi:hypothetical protein
MTKAGAMKNDRFKLACERILGESLADVATELRLVNVIDLIGYVRAGRFANLEDLVNSSAELYFRHGALRYGWSAELDVVWHSPPTVCLDMEYCWRDVTIFFRLSLNARRAGVEIRHIDFAGGETAAPNRLRRLSQSLAESRLAPPPRAAAGPALRDASL